MKYDYNKQMITLTSDNIKWLSQYLKNVLPSYVEDSYQIRMFDALKEPVHDAFQLLLSIGFWEGNVYWHKYSRSGVHNSSPVAGQTWPAGRILCMPALDQYLFFILSFYEVLNHVI